MAVTNRNSNVIANAVATPKVLNQPAIGGPSVLKEAAGLVTPAADDSATSVFRFCRVPSNARISQVLISNLAASSAGNVDVGIYQTADNGSAVVDADFFASAVALTAAKENSDLTQESGEMTVTESMQPLWQALGLSADSQREYDVAATITTTFNGGPTAISLKVRYVQ